MLNKTYIAGALLAGLATVSTGANAATSAGNGSFGAQGTYSESDASDQIQILGRGSYFVTAALEVSVSAFLQQNDTGAGESTDDAFILVGGGVQYNFLTDGDIVPFVGMSYDYTGLGDFDETDFYTVFAGMRHFVAENVALRYDLVYSGATDSDFDALDSTSLRFGVDWFF